MRSPRVVATGGASPRSRHRRRPPGRLDHDHGVELEAVGLVGREEDQAGRQARRPGVPGVDRVEPGIGEGAGQLGQQHGRAEHGHPPRGHRRHLLPGGLGHGRRPDPARDASTIRGENPDWRTGRGGAIAGAATASTRAATSITSAGVR